MEDENNEAEDIEDLDKDKAAPSNKIGKFYSYLEVSSRS